MNKLLLILLLGCAACTTQAQDPKPSTPSAPPAARSDAPSNLLTQIRALTADKTCSDTSQCRSLPIGAMACGGPQDYLPYSSLRTDEKAVRELAERYKAERQGQIAKRGEMSICRFHPDPGAVCVSGACQLGASPEAGQAR